VCSSDLVRSVFDGSPLKIRNPGAIRPWQHVLEPLSGYLLLGKYLMEENAKFAEAWNFGPESENCIPVSDLIRLIRNMWKDIKVDIAPAQFHESSILMLDCSKANKLLKWKSIWGIEETISNTINWYKKLYLQNEVQTENDLLQYISDAKNAKLIWTE
jgi:CDP-glucose 4,6-dehydratase